MSTKDPPRPGFVIELRAEKGCDDPVRALRLLLKVALRRYGLRCTSAALLKPRERP